MYTIKDIKRNVEKICVWHLARGARCATNMHPQGFPMSRFCPLRNFNRWE